MKSFVFLFIAALILVSCQPTTAPVTTTTLSTVSTPVIIPSGGKLIITDTITMSCATSGSIILYTLDGTDPTTSSKVYTGPIKVSEGSLVIKAMGYQAGANNSAIATAAFTVSMPVNRWIKNSKWKTVKTAYVAPTKDLTEDSALAEELAAYNAANTSDQYFLTTEDTPVTLAPTADIWITVPVTNKIIEEWHNVDRSLVDGRYAAWESDARARAGVLYIDKQPPAETVPVVVVDTRPDYEKYAIYALDSSGKIMIETHCEDYNTIDMPTETKAQYFARRVLAFQSDVNQHQGTKSGEPWSLKSGQLYTPPSE